MTNPCVFSKDRVYRYSLVHKWEPGPRLVVIGLNPSTADEQQLDPTLKRVRGFAQSVGCGKFVMLNLFAFRATKPTDMFEAKDPVGPDNDARLRATLHVARDKGEHVLCAWGNGGSFRDRDVEVTALIKRYNIVPYCLGVTGTGQPKHPLYVAGSTLWKIYKGRQP